MAKQLNSLRDSKRRPTHPGAILREDVLPALRMTQTEFAQRLSESRLTVSEILQEKSTISPDMASRIGRLLGNGAAIWLRMQQALDVWQLELQGDYQHIKPVDKETA